MDIFALMHSIQTREAAHEGYEYDNEDDTELDDVMKHTSKRHQQRSELFTGRQQMGEAGETGEDTGDTMITMATEVVAIGGSGYNDNGTTTAK